jgi:hypothetical protein
LRDWFRDSKALIAMLVAILLAVPSELFSAPQNAPQASQSVRQAIANTTAAVGSAALNLRIDNRSPKRFQDSIANGWAYVFNMCPSGQITDQCAAAAILMASNECSASAKWFKRDSRTWLYLNIGLLLASAIFTGVGASTTIANAKVWSTLGGTTGLGAVTSSVNANVSSDQAGVASVNATLASFITFATTGGANKLVPPSIISAASASGTVGSPFSFQIVATNSPTGYTATGLPADLSVNASGLISGTPMAAGPSTVTLGATNAGGTGNATLTLTIAAMGSAPPAPAITSATSANGTVGTAFAYQTAASNSPTSYTVTGNPGLPAGLSMNASGLISGTPTAAGTSSVTLAATNAAGTGNATLTLTIVAAAAPGSSIPASNELIFKIAPLYGGQCAAAATASSGK